MNFDKFNAALITQFQLMQTSTLYKVNLSRDQLWTTYLESFPEGTDPIYRERSYHDCQCCKQFIRTVGNVVAIINGRMESIWNVELDDEYQEVTNSMAELVGNAEILHPFLHYEKNAGTPVTHSHEDDGTVRTWNHFSLTLPQSVIAQKDQIPTKISKLRASKDVFQRSLEEISLEAVDTVLELIGQKSLYRGEEHQRTLQRFRQAKKIVHDNPNIDLNLFAWEAVGKIPVSVLRLRNTSIGTLLLDLSEGKELDQAVGAFESMVAPANYKRPTALITPTMIKKAQKQVEELGFSEALSRRHAVPEDITVNNVIFANRAARKAMEGDVFDQLIENTPVNPQNLSKVEEIDIETFVSEVVPMATQIELLLENRQIGNLMTLVAPVHADAPNMLKWDNNFSWAYNGDVADSMKERVKAAGGDVEGVLRFSIQWNDDNEWNRSDYDAHVLEPGGNRIFFGAMRHDRTTGKLDVDVIHPEKGVPAVENITWTNPVKMETGTYIFSVHGYTVRSENIGFSAEFEFNGQIHSYDYNRPVGQDRHVQVLKGTWDGSDFVITDQLPSTLSSRTIWDIPTMQYQNVSMIMLSPNHWDDNNVGNKHYFFILEGCKQPGKIRGFYNEFLTDDLREHRKVFEVLGAKMKAEEADIQLSGLGFSSTKRNHVYCRVSGNFDRTVKITF
jgi:hypothetical protein